MMRDQGGPILSAVFVDYDNIYLSLRRKSEEAAKRFAKDTIGWLKAIETGALITPTSSLSAQVPRRIVMNRCYGNPVPRRNTTDNSTDMSSFPFVRHHFLRAGFEVVDCPPLTAQLKNSSDIRMVMDLRDYLSHETRFDEFIIMSGDADFTPVLHRLRAHARRTVIYATEHTAAPYTAVSDGEIREVDLISLLLESQAGGETTLAPAEAPAPAPSLEATRRAIIDEVIAAVRVAAAPVPLEVLADRAVRAIGHERTIGTAWAGAGGFRELLSQGLPQGFRLSGEPPYVVIDTQRHLAQQAAPQRLQAQPLQAQPLQSQAMQPADIADVRVDRHGLRDEVGDARSFAGLGMARATEPPQKAQHAQAAATATHAHGAGMQPMRRSPLAEQPLVTPPKPEAPASQVPSIQQSIARIHEACKAPPLAPPEYRLLFETIAQEINENGLIGAQTIQNIVQRALERGIDVRRDDVRFVLEVVSEADPWFEQGASANLFAGRFRNFVVARCRSQGLNLSADELDLVEAWFANSSAPTRQPAAVAPAAPAPTYAPPPRSTAPHSDAAYWSGLEESRQQVAEPRGRPLSAPADPVGGDDFPRIVRTRLRG